MTVSGSSSIGRPIGSLDHPRSSRRSIARVLRGVAVAASALLLAGLVVLPSGDALASEAPRTFHIDCRSAVSGTGAAQHPWNRLSDAEAHGAFQPGDRILLRRGTTCHGQLLLSGSGTTARPVLVGAYGTGALPTVAGDGTPDGTGAVQLVDASHWTIQDLHVTNRVQMGSSIARRSGVLLLNATAKRLAGLTVRRLRVDHVSSYPWATLGRDPRGFGGITAVTESVRPGAGFDRLQILDNRVDHVGRTGIVTWNNQAWTTGSQDRGLRISGNTVSWTVGDGILVVSADGARIDHNVSAHASNLPPCPIEICPDSRPTATAGIWPILSRHLRIDHNEAYGTKWGPGDGEGFDIDNSTSDVIFENNYAHDNEGGGLLLCGSRRVTVRFNIFQNNAKSALVFIGSVPAYDTQIYNNTIYNGPRSRARPVRFFHDAFKTSITFRNNIVYNLSLSTWVWPAKPKTAANTVVGHRGAFGPTDRSTSFRDPRLIRPGSGKVGFASLKGYRPKNPKKALHGTAIPRDVRTDFFGRRIDPKHPPRGAVG